MNPRDEFQQRARSIEGLVNQLEGAADPAVRSAARALVQAVMDLHGSSIERILEIVNDSGEPGKTLIDRFGHDELVRSVLLLYGLHPQDLHTRVLEALDSLRTFLRSHGASAELVSIDGAGVVSVELQAKLGGCGSAATSVRATVEAAIQEAAPDAASIVVDDASNTDLAGPTFVSVAALRSGQAMTALSARRVQRSGD
jgi:Fe-S cluster biogenesis protein NfuA